MLTVLAAVSAPLVAWFGKLLIDELTLGSGGDAGQVTLYAVAGAVAAAAGVFLTELNG